MSVQLRTAGLTVEVSALGRSATRWTRLVREACAGQALEVPARDTQELGGPEPSSQARAVDVVVTVGDGAPVRAAGRHRPVTRGAWTDGEEVILEDACSSGLDLLLRPVGDRLEVVARPAPDWRHRALGLAAPERRLLLHRAVLLQYPALWWAGVRGVVPVHVSAVAVGGLGVVLAGPGGLGKSTLVATVGAPGTRTDATISDNLCVTDGAVVHGLLEPSRTTAGAGRRMPHGRRESAWRLHRDSVAADCVLVLRRGSGADAVVRPVDSASAARELVAGTYAAGELRRYWAFAATLALATGRGPAHPPVAEVAERLARRVPAYLVDLPTRPGATLDDLVTRARALRLPAGEGVVVP